MGYLCALVSSYTNTRKGKSLLDIWWEHPVFSQRLILLQDPIVFRVDRFPAITIDPLGIGSDHPQGRTVWGRFFEESTRIRWFRTTWDHPSSTYSCIKYNVLGIAYYSDTLVSSGTNITHKEYLYWISRTHLFQAFMT